MIYREKTVMTKSFNPEDHVSSLAQSLKHLHNLQQR